VKRTIVPVILIAALVLTSCMSGKPAASEDLSKAMYRDPSRPVSERVEDLLGRMTLQEKVGQMTQIDVDYLKGNATVVSSYYLGSVLSGGGGKVGGNDPASWAAETDKYQKAALSTRLGIPIIFGVDAVHGHNKMKNTTIFPHNIGLGATRDADLVERIARITAVEMRATGMQWNFAPCVTVPQDLRWGRTYEGYGEDTALVTSLGAAALRGYQGASLSDPASVLATAKHFVADGATQGGLDQGNAVISEEVLRSVHLPPYFALVEAGAQSVMASFSSWNGEKMHGNDYLLTDVLRGELGFTGFVISDWAALKQLNGSPTQQVVDGIMAGVDMVMVPDDWMGFVTTTMAAVQDGLIPQERIDEAVRRILTVKFEMGLFERPMSDASLMDSIGSPEHRAVAREAVQKSQVLLKNEGAVLPIAKDSSRIIVAGSKASDMGAQVGGWTISWQGSLGPVTKGTTILEGITAAASGTVDYAPNGVFEGSADVIIAVVGENPYAEFQGDINLPGFKNPGWYTPRTEADWGLSAKEKALVEKLSATGIPVVLVVLSGRPINITEESARVSAVVASWLPGTEGNGVSDVLFGDVKPTGKLSFGWPTSVEYTSKASRDAGKGVLYPYGFGLTYP